MGASHLNMLKQIPRKEKLEIKEVFSCDYFLQLQFTVFPSHPLKFQESISFFLNTIIEAKRNPRV
jgi:hypothetical protein